MDFLKILLIFAFLQLTLKDMPVMATNQLKITGIPKLNAKRFSINIGLGEENIALQFDVRFEFHNDRNTTVFSYKQNNSTWTNVVKDEHFPFEQGEEFKVPSHLDLKWPEAIHAGRVEGRFKEE
ncbi:galactose-binding lectin l-1-like [Paramormyrops kingsleyae]|uniref:galactose-binding lectin l-1-like n=1 Tax=Paramormyrops kingsleyae TaxID=1676925 RepID=UPI003B97CB49